MMLKNEDYEEVTADVTAGLLKLLVQVAKRPGANDGDIYMVLGMSVVAAAATMDQDDWPERIGTLGGYFEEISKHHELHTATKEEAAKWKRTTSSN